MITTYMAHKCYDIFNVYIIHFCEKDLMFVGQEEVKNNALDVMIQLLKEYIKEKLDTFLTCGSFFWLNEVAVRIEDLFIELIKLEIYGTSHNKILHTISFFNEERLKMCKILRPQKKL